jgi:adenine/guanine phosphoribosyltransferase-like PRPP-binding protein
MPVSTYLLLNNRNRRTAINRCVKKLKDVDFDAIICTGTSGLLVAPTVAIQLKKTLIVRRKSAAGHHGYLTEGWDSYTSPPKYVIIDDFVESGNTINKLLEKFGVSQCVGIYLYNSKRAPYFIERFSKRNPKLKVVKV